MNFDDQEVTETILFHFSLAGMRNFEQVSGKNFFKEYSNAFPIILEFFKLAKVAKMPTPEELEKDEEMIGAILPLLAEPTVNQFIVNYIISFYAERKNGRFIQDETTIEKAENALWLTEFLNIGFFMEVFNELSKNNLTTKKA